METKNRIFYEAPATEVVDLRFNGILCESINGTTSASMDGTFVEESI
jgi:hypothetical protein